MPVFTKHSLSGSDKGMPITVTATAAAGAQLIHQGQTATISMELVSLWVHSNASTNPSDPVIQVTNGVSGISSFSQLGTQATNSAFDYQTIQIFSQIPFSGTDIAIHAYATSTSGFLAWGHVDRIATG